MPNTYPTECGRANVASGLSERAQANVSHHLSRASSRRARHPVVLASFCLAALLLGGASFAWACGPQPSIRLRPTSGPAGSHVNVSGASFRSGDVEIHWDSVNGPVLGTAMGPSFSETVRIPRTEEGVYYIVAVLYQAGPHNGPGSPEDTGRGQNAAAAFEVTSAVTSQPENRAQKEAPTKTVSGGGKTSQTTSAGSARGGRSSIKRGARLKSSLPASAQPGAVVADAGGSVFGGSVPAMVSNGAARRKSTSRTPSERWHAPSARLAGDPPERTASVDLWSGFRSGQKISLPALDALSPPGGSHPALTLGVALISVGLIGLVGFAALRMRRRPSEARAKVRGGG